jgi:signal transduction histidine kinase/ligand-binding sensor domain-containing protein
MKKVYLFFLCITLTFSAFGQLQRFMTYQVDQGLPTNMTKAIAHDEHGFAWIGTDIGLVRFDGKNFGYYRGFKGSWIKSFFKRSNGQLFVIHDGGVTLIKNDIDTVSFHDFFGTSLSGVDSTLHFAKSAYEDSKGNIWFSENQSIVKYHGNTFKRYLFQEKDRTSSYLRSFSISEDGYGNIYAASQQGRIFKYDSDTDSFEEIPHPQIGNINAMVLIEPGKLWLGTDNGIREIIFNDQGTLVSSQRIVNLKGVSTLLKTSKGGFYAGTWNDGVYRLSNDKDKWKITFIPYIPYKVINNLYLDVTDKIWVSSDDGIGHLDVTPFAKFPITTQRNYIQSVISGPRGKLFVTDGYNIYQIDKQNLTHKEIDFERLDGDDLLSLAFDGEQLYFGTTKGYLYEFKKGKNTKVNLNANGKSIFYLEVDKQRNIWACQFDAKGVSKVDRDHNITFYDASKGLKTEGVYTVKQAPNGKMYCSGNGNESYLFVFNENLDTWQNISVPVRRDEFENFEVHDITFDVDESVWLGSNHGLFRVNDNELKHYPLYHPVDNSLVTLIKSIKGNSIDGLWIGTDLGLIRYKRGVPVLFDEQSGLPTKSLSFRSLVYDFSLKSVWAGTASGIGFSQLQLETPHTPKPVFLSLEVNGKKINGDRANKPSFRNNSYLKVSFVALSYPGHKVVYQYRLAGSDSDWSAPSSQNELTLPQLTDGQYRLEIRALQQGGYMLSEPLVFQFSINKPWYFSWWGVIGFILLFFIIGYLSVKLYLNRIIKEKQRLENLVRERTYEILMQREEIEAQRDEIEKKNITLLRAQKTIEEQNNKLKETNQELEIKVNHRTNELQNAYIELLAVNKELDTFVYRASHDLKGPIARLIGLCNLAKMEVKDNLTLEYINKMDETASKMNLLLYRLLNINKIKTSDVKIDHIDIPMAISQVLGSFTSEGYNLGEISIKLNIDQDIEFYSDKELVNIILDNLLSNALKFSSKEASPYIEVKVVRKNDDFVSVYVMDNGAGINEKFEDRIFDMFFVGNDNIKGEGLGLYAVKMAVKKLNGSVQLVKTNKKLTIFEVVLPLNQKESPVYKI